MPTEYFFLVVFALLYFIKLERRFIEFYVFQYDSLPYLFSLFFWLRVTFPLVAPDRILSGTF